MGNKSRFRPRWSSPRLWSSGSPSARPTTSPGPRGAEGPGQTDGLVSEDIHGDSSDRWHARCWSLHPGPLGRASWAARGPQHEGAEFAGAGARNAASGNQSGQAPSIGTDRGIEASGAAWRVKSRPRNRNRGRGLGFSLTRRVAPELAQESWSTTGGCPRSG